MEIIRHLLGACGEPHFSILYTIPFIGGICLYLSYVKNFIINIFKKKK